MRRWEIINWLIGEHGYKSYLEIGIDNPSNCFDHIALTDKTGVDPHKATTFRMTSDAFFAQNVKTFDIMFIDGLHLDEQVRRDIGNSIANLNDGGTIIVHDCHPYKEDACGDEQRPGQPWFGTTYRAYAFYRHTRPDLRMHCVNDDCGLGIIQRGAQDVYPVLVDTWEKYIEHQDAMLNLISHEQLVEIYGRKS